MRWTKTPANQRKPIPSESYGSYQTTSQLHSFPFTSLLHMEDGCLLKEGILCPVAVSTAVYLLLFSLSVSLVCLDLCFLSEFFIVSQSLWAACLIRIISRSVGFDKINSIVFTASLMLTLAPPDIGFIVHPKVDTPFANVVSCYWWVH